MNKELLGACDCGAVRYRITGPVRLIVNCHCNSCRTRNGAPYSTYCVVAQSDLDIVQGRDKLATYEKQGGKKVFCSVCGSPLYNLNPLYAGLFMVMYGSLSDNATLMPMFNVFCESKLPWVENIASIKSFEKAIER